MFCDTRYLLHWIATKVLCFCVISSFIYWCAVSISICRRARTAWLPFQHQAWAVSFGPTNYEECLHRSEWVSEWVTHLHIGVPITNLVSTLCVTTRLKISWLSNNSCHIGPIQCPRGYQESSRCGPFKTEHPKGMTSPHAFYMEPFPWDAENLQHTCCS